MWLFESGSTQANIAAFCIGFVICIAAIRFYRIRKAKKTLNGKKTEDSSHHAFVKPPKPRPCPKIFRLDELAKYNGTSKPDARDGNPIYISVCGIVYDVSSHPTGREFYGPDGPYHVFAGSDATVALATMSLDKAVLNSADWKNGDLNDAQQQTLSEWIVKFKSKYDVVGQVEGMHDGKSNTLAQSTNRKIVN